MLKQRLLEAEFEPGAYGLQVYNQGIDTTKWK